MFVLFVHSPSYSGASFTVKGSRFLYIEIYTLLTSFDRSSVFRLGSEFRFYVSRRIIVILTRMRNEKRCTFSVRAKVEEPRDADYVVIANLYINYYWFRAIIFKTETFIGFVSKRYDRRVREMSKL